MVFVFSFFFKFYVTGVFLKEDKWLTLTSEEWNWSKRVSEERGVGEDVVGGTRGGPKDDQK